MASVIGCLTLIPAGIWWIQKPLPAEAPVARRGEQKQDPSSRRSASFPIAKVSQSTTAPASEGVFLLPDVEQTARELNSPEFTVERDLAILRELLEFYRRSNDGLVPEGGMNEEIVARMCGANPKKFAVLPPSLPAINPTGQLVDRWGTPYFLHPVSGRLIEIRSAGADRKMWTKDDICDPAPDQEQVAINR